jgi:hypothetical protein
MRKIDREEMYHTTGGGDDLNLLSLHLHRQDLRFSSLMSLCKILCKILCNPCSRCCFCGGMESSVAPVSKKATDTQLRAGAYLVEWIFFCVRNDHMRRRI